MYKWTAFFLIFLAGCLSARDLKEEISLNLNWRFELGDNIECAKPDYDDSDWEYIKVPDNWEDQGFPGYDGFAWYRVHLKISRRLEKKSLYLMMGSTDDAGEIYINGKFLGRSGSFPPEYQSALIHDRMFHLNNDYIHFGKTNVIAVRIYDAKSNGGIKSGKAGIYSCPKITLTMDLSGKWKFSPGDALIWADPAYEDSEWDSIQVPDYWENQGYPFLDGYAWYRKKFDLPKKQVQDQIILSLGLIDAADVVFFNGQIIGKTGSFPEDEVQSTSSWLNDRLYPIPSQLIHWNGSNCIAVRVHDVSGPGGIYDGPIGLTTQELYLKYVQSNNSLDDLIDRIYEKLRQKN